MDVMQIPSNRLEERRGEIFNVFGHFIPLFVMRKEDVKKVKIYYYRASCGIVCESAALQSRDDGKTISLMTAGLRLAKPLSAELYRHLTNQSDA